jgi:hypothetical protein
VDGVEAMLLPVRLSLHEQHLSRCRAVRWSLRDSRPTSGLP